VPFVFRLDGSEKRARLPEEGREALLHEMLRGHLRQGWGSKGMSLLDRKGNLIPRDEWVRNFLKAIEHWEPEERTEKKARGHYRLLSAMLEIRVGDRIVIPNFSEDGLEGLVIAVAIRDPSRPKGVGECYGFSSSVPPELGDDRRHYVAVDRLGFKFIPLNRAGTHLKRLIDKGGYRVRVRRVNSRKHPALIRAIERIAKADIQEPTKTIKTAKVAKPPDFAQRVRGLKGEKEILRRLKLPGGHLGLTYKDDHRKNGCGYDFLAHDGKRSVEVEVKAFDGLTGQIFFTPKELAQALASKDRYYLWALLDNGGHPKTWELITLNDPHAELKRVGEEQIQIVYRIRPKEVRWEKPPGSPAKKRAR
jgi:hypothetical protein